MRRARQAAIYNAIRRGNDSRNVWKDGLPIGSESTCPICGTVCFCPFAADGSFEWWPDASRGHCAHFRGFYQGARIGDPYALFGGPS